MIAQIEEIGKALLEAVALAQKNESDLQELQHYNSNKADLEKALESKRAELKDLEDAWAKRRSEFGHWKASSEAAKEKSIKDLKMEIEAQRAELVRDYQKAIKELNEAREAAQADTVRAIHERDEAQQVRDELQKQLKLLRERLG